MSPGTALERLTRWIETAATAVSVAALVVVAVAMAAQVIWRYLLQDPLHWSEPVAVYALVWLVFLGAAGLAARDEHISIPTLVERLPRRAGLAARIVGRLATLAFAGVVVWYGAGWIATGSHTMAPGLPFNTRWVKVALPVGLALMFLCALARLARDVAALVGRDKDGG